MTGPLSSRASKKVSKKIGSQYVKARAQIRVMYNIEIDYVVLERFQREFLLIYFAGMRGPQVT